MRPFVIKNVKIVLETKTINLGYLLIRDGVIAEVGEQPVPEALAAQDAYCRRSVDGFCPQPVHSLYEREEHRPRIVLL